MTINKNQILEMVKKVLKHREGLEDQPIVHPVREWFIGLGTGLLIFISIAVGSAYTYWHNKEVNITFADAPAETTVYRESQVKDALKRYAARDAERQNLIAEFSGQTPAAPQTASTTVSSSSEITGTSTASTTSTH